MDETLNYHLKAYGLAFYILNKQQTLNWLLNFQGGSFLLDSSNEIIQE